MSEPKTISLEEAKKIVREFQLAIKDRASFSNSDWIQYRTAKAIVHASRGIEKNQSNKKS